MKEIELLQSSSVNNPVISSPRLKAAAASTQAQPSIKYDIEYGDNVYVITVKFYADNFKDSKILLEQMKSKNIDYITVEIILNDKFPFEPPFLRVVKPIFKQLTGHITLGGSICHEILSSTGWTATTKLLQLLEFIVVEINQGKPELDMETRKTEYGLEEAKQAYSRMLSSHGWK
jgi:ubiquitin-conjugating enzyme E2 Q